MLNIIISSLFPQYRVELIEESDKVGVATWSVLVVDKAL